jgi:4-cresol dehydrogenase (hydroxylating) flavoprotein subunit
MTALPQQRTHLSEAPFAEATRAWRQAIGDSRIVTDTSRYNIDTSSFAGEIPVALRPASTEQVQAIVRIAQHFGTPIYPVSTARNWGYGTSVPPRSPAAIVDLSEMNRIIDFDSELGVVTLEPGVAQGDLRQYLEAHNLPFMVPVTGAGPNCSILANALERGFGVTPITDHFGAIMSMKAVLPNGELYESYGRSFNSAGVAQAFKWGSGPYLDGLFSQSSFGIVVDASIALQAKAECTGALLFALDANQEVEDATASLRMLLDTAGHNIGAINLMSRTRVACMLGGARKLQTSPGPDPSIPAGAWFGFGSVYGSKEHYRATCRLVRRCLKGRARQIRIYTADDVARLRWLSTLAAAAGWPHLTGVVDRLEAAIGVVSGIPSTFALPLAYVASGRRRGSADLDPARDGCGLFWYAPLVPLRTAVVRQFIDFVERICSKHGLLPAITLTTLSPRCYAATIPLLFDRANPDAERQARACFEELYEEGLTLGLLPYRIGSQFMPALARHPGQAGPLVNAIKSAIDPHRVMAPGRYSFG